MDRTTNYIRSINILLIGIFVMCMFMTIKYENRLKNIEQQNKEITEKCDSIIDIIYMKNDVDSVGYFD